MMNLKFIITVREVSVWLGILPENVSAVSAGRPLNNEGKPI